MLFIVLLLFVLSAAAPFDPTVVYTDTVDLEQRGPPVIALASFGLAVGQAVAAWEKADKEERNEFTVSTLDEVNAQYPGNNVFIYHIGDDTFSYTVPANAAKKEVSIDHGGFLGFFGVKEHYEVVMFHGPGVLERHNSDGGYLNWAWSGWWTVDPDKTVVTFAMPS